MRIRSRYLLSEAMDRLNAYLPYKQKDLERNPFPLLAAIDNLVEFLGRNKSLREEPEIKDFLCHLPEWCFGLAHAYGKKNWAKMDEIYEKLVSFTLFISGKVVM